MILTAAVVSAFSKKTHKTPKDKEKDNYKDMALPSYDEKQPLLEIASNPAKNLTFPKYILIEKGV
ncbi:hypothetical protein HK099_007637 [Clydaea vesicula]|uniref:Uncharacterized protein n=1 Tax=Clydaea vesicula TaxID=447962 RepID=A0AAD5U8X5_9FUNG|nr:hypothetical protein HK099_007637 [Clydaea vesicula]KAJ3394795.1 hypothetical protein HDU92_006584 [Lobulomyces angularis]